MDRTQTLRTLFFSAWLLLVVGIVVAISNQDRFFAVDNKAVASLTKKNGPVQVRTEGLVRWTDAIERQGLFDGDRVATGRGSTGKVSFNSGRVLDLGEDTQIQIRTIVTSSRDAAYVITLFRGTMVAAVQKDCRDCPQLVVRAGDETYNVNAGAKVGVFKPVGRKSKKFDPERPWPNAEGGLLVLSSAAVEEEAKLASPAVAKDGATAKLAGMAPTLRMPSTGLTYYTVQPLAALGAVSIDIPFSLPAARPETIGSELRAVAKINGLGARSEIVQAARASDREIRIPLAKVRGIATGVKKGAFREYAFSVRGGIQVVKGSQRAENFGDTKLDFKVRSYGEPAGGAVTFGVDRLAVPTDSGPWVSSKGELVASQAPVVVRLASSQDYPKFLPFIRAASRFGMAESGVQEGSGVYVVRDRVVVAQVAGSAVDATIIRKVMVQLGADFVFEGAKNAFHSSRGTSQTALVGWVGDLLDKGKILYILKRNKLYPVSRDFIKTNAEVAQFVDSQANAIFLEKVRILDYR